LAIEGTEIAEKNPKSVIEFSVFILDFLCEPLRPWFNLAFVFQQEGMNDDELKSLLQGAESGLHKRAFAAGELTERVRALDRARKRRARVLLTAAPLVAIVAAALAWQIFSGQGGPPFDASELERLRTEAEYHERVAREMMAQMELERSRRRMLATADPLDEIRQQVDVVAYRMILRADNLQTEMMASREAIELYRDVLKLFPKTYSADVARQRLSALGESLEET
jgi:hypothetical protein